MKKGFFFPQWFLFKIATIFIIILGIILVSMFIFSSTKVESIQPLKARLYTEQLISSPNCFAATNDLSGTALINTIDINKFNNKTFQGCLLQEGITHPHIPAKATLINEQTQETMTVQTQRWNDVSMQKTITYVTIIDKYYDKKETGKMIISYYFPNEGIIN